MLKNFMDSKLFHGMNKVVDWLVLAFLFVLCCIPIFTIGTAIASLYYTLHKVIFTERSYLFQEYFHAFKDNFLKGTACTFILGLLGFFFAWDYSICAEYAKAGSNMGYMSSIFVVFGIFLGIWAIYLFTMMARFNLTLKALLKNSLFVGFYRVSSSIGVIVVYLLMFVLPIYLQSMPVILEDGTVVTSTIFDILPLLLFFVVIYLTIMHKPLENIFRCVMSEEDRNNEIEMERLTKGTKTR